jgi:hypothetical protein
MRAPLAVFALLMPTLLAGCASPEGGPCVPLRLLPESTEVNADYPFADITVEVTNCGDAPLEVSTGACGLDLLPRLSDGNETWVLRKGAALRPEGACNAADARGIRLPPGETYPETARWNGFLERDDGSFSAASPGDYTTSATVQGETVTGKVRVL